MRRDRLSAILVVFCIAAALGTALVVGGVVTRVAHAQTPAQKLPAGTGENTPADDLQRSFRIDHYTEVADSGGARGENIYYHKCWVCHNKYQTEAPHLQELFKHAKLSSGSPVNDQNVIAKVQNGGPAMPSFRTSLTDAEIGDVVAYLHEGTCCFEGEELPQNPWYRASAQKWPVQNTLSGGARGAVRIASGDSPAGIKVQLIAPNGVRTTVYTNDEGIYEFPAMQAGSYTLRIATPLEFKPFRRDSVRIDGASKLEEIVLERISSKETLPATPEVLSQLSGAELLWNLPGTAEEKDTFHRACGSGCHSYQQILRNRYDERSWRTIVGRMSHRGGGPLINPPGGAIDRASLQEDEVVIQWLTRVRGPESKDGPVRVFPRSAAASARAVVTEFELPRVFLGGHDVYGDANRDIWFTSHMTRYVGRLDPRTGIVTEYKIPLTPGALPGTHHVVVDKHGTVLFSENWTHKLTKFDPRTEKFTQVSMEPKSKINSAGFGDFAVAPDGSVWTQMNDTDHVEKVDPQTGKILKQYPIKNKMSYDSLVSSDGNFWAGGSPSGAAGNSAELLDIRTGKMLDFDTGSRPSSGKRGGFDPFGNPWFGGVNGTFVELDVKAGRIR